MVTPTGMQICRHCGVDPGPLPDCFIPRGRRRGHLLTMIASMSPEELLTMHRSIRSMYREEKAAEDIDMVETAPSTECEEEDDGV